MTQYNKIEDAVLDITIKYGNNTLCNTPCFISLLSDYAPNFPTEQKDIRLFARANGLSCIFSYVEKQTSYSSMLAAISELTVQITDDIDQRFRILNLAKSITLIINGHDKAPVDASEVFGEAMRYYRSFPKESNRPIALLLLEEAWNMGSKDALLYLSRSYLKGKGVPVNKKKGMQYLELAAEAGDVRASIEFAEHLWKGTDVAKNLLHAIAILETVNDCNAYYLLGNIYNENKEYDKAFLYYLKASEDNHVYAQFETALAYATGQGVTRDIEEAKRWLKTAAELGHGEARQKLEELGERWV